MRPLRTLFVCAIAAGGIAALAAAGSASAALPEFLECHKVKRTGAFSDSGCSITEPKHKGRYELGEVTHECVKARKVNKHFTGRFKSKTCTEESGSHEGKFELEKGVRRGNPFRDAANVVVLYVGNEFIHCNSGDLRGLVTGPKTVGEVSLALKGCAYGDQDACSSGSVVGEIDAVPLSGDLGYIDAPEHEVGVDLAAEGGGAVVPEVTCAGGGGPYQITGSIILGLTGDLNAISSEFGLSSGGSSEHIDVESFEGGPTDVLEWGVPLGGSIAMPVEAYFEGEGEKLEVSG